MVTVCEELIYINSVVIQLSIKMSFYLPMSGIRNAVIRDVV